MNMESEVCSPLVELSDYGWDTIIAGFSAVRIVNRNKTMCSQISHGVPTSRRRPLNVFHFVIPRTAQSLVATSSGLRNALLDVSRKLCNATQQQQEPRPGIFSPLLIIELSAHMNWLCYEAHLASDKPTVRGELKVSESQATVRWLEPPRYVRRCTHLLDIFARFEFEFPFSSKERARGFKLQFPSTFQLASLPGKERPYRGLRSRWLTTRSWSDVYRHISQLLSSFTVSTYFRSLVVARKQKQKLKSCIRSYSEIVNILVCRMF
jgi:hypothetical protein